MGFVLRMALREVSRQAGRLVLIALCLAVGFAAFFATYGFSGRVLGGVRAESRALLGGDLSVSSRVDLPRSAVASARGLEDLAASVQVWDFPTMASAGSGEGVRTKLVELRVVEAGYPLAGRLDCSPSRDPGREPWGLLVDRGLARAWGLGPGDRESPAEDLLGRGRALRLGSGIVPIEAIVDQDDSRQAAAFALGPRIYLGKARAQALELLGPRSRLSSRLLLLLAPGSDAAGAAARLRARLPVDLRVRVQTHEEAASALARPIRNLNRFVQQLGLFTLLLALLGAWAILGAYLEGRSREAAILRCLGAPPAAPAATYALVTALLVGQALALGAAAGMGAGSALPALLGDLIPPAIRNGPWVLPPALETTAAGAMLVLVVLPSLLRLADAGPMDLLRGGEADAGRRRGFALACGLLAAGLAAFLVVRNAPSPKVGLVTAVAMAALFLVLFGVSRLLLRVYRRSAPVLPLPLKLALGQLGARPALAALMMSVMGLAVFLVLATQFVKDDLVAPLAAQRGAGRRPNLFFIDVQPDQIEALRSLVEARTGREPYASPMVRARLAAIAGRPVVENPHAPGQEEGGGEHLRTREQNLTWRERLSDSEAIAAGRFWEGAGPKPEISLEEGFARAVGAKLGDELAFDVQGTVLRGTVTSLRRVKWQSFQPNFFIVLHPSLLEGAPAVWVVAAELEGAQARAALQAQVVAAFPNLSSVDIGEVVARIGRVLDLVALVTRALGGLMLASALLVLAASLLAGRLGRQRDLALLRTLGAGHGTLVRSLAWEFLLLGGSAATGAGCLAWVLAREYSVRVLELEANPSPLAAALLLVLVAVLTAAVGLAGSLRALRAKPMEVLRSE